MQRLKTKPDVRNVSYNGRTSNVRVIPQRNKIIDISGNSKEIFERRYLRKNPEGSFTETIEDVFRRVSKCVAEPDRGYRNVDVTEIEFYNLLTAKKFFPNSPTFTGAQTPLGQLAACFVLPIADDLGNGEDGIFSTLRAAALIQKVGGGNGFSFSKLRPRGTNIKSSNGKSTGPLGFLRIYDVAFGEIALGGIRRGANMAVLRVDHPDIKEFISCKSTEGKIENFNISVGVTDEFMMAVENDGVINLIDPHDGKVTGQEKARDLFNMIVSYAHKNGEPGVLLIDTANRSNPVPHLYELEATNPCGEQWLGPWENCCLGSVNLSKHINDDGTFDWGGFKESIALGTRFLDNVVTANKYVEALPQLKEAAENVRRIGLGFMGLADSMYELGIRYGSDEGCEFASQVTEFLRYHSMLTSIELARERGPFPAIKGSVYDPRNLKWKAPTPLVEYTRDWGRPGVDWSEVVEGIKKYGIRNGAQTTIAPTGEIATIAGCEGYGCEPVFALSYSRNVFQSAGNDKKLTLKYTLSPLFEKALQKTNIDPLTYGKIVSEVTKVGSCQHIEEVPESVRNTFVVSSDVTPDEHVMMQASIQSFIDNSLSKTCNFSETATEEDVARVYMKAWKLGCKGITVYVSGSRKEIVLETKNVKEAEEDRAAPVVRPQKLEGSTYKIKTPVGTSFITVNKDEGGDPVEVFINIGRAGSDVSAMASAIARLVSKSLQWRGNISRRDKVVEIVDQLKGSGGTRAVGFGVNKVMSLPDAVARALAMDLGLNNQNEENGDEKLASQNTDNKSSKVDICPDCGNASLVHEEGCKKCYSCGFSEC